MRHGSLLHSVQNWLRSRGGAYAHMVALLGLTLPFIFLALSRYVDGKTGANIAGLYAGLLFAGYYPLVLLVLLTALFALFMLWPRLATRLGAFLIGGTLFYLIIDSTVYRIYRFHVDAFWIEYVFKSFSGIGISGAMIAMALGILALVAGLVWGLSRVAGRMRHRGRFVAAVVVLIALSYTASQALHVLAYERNDTRITDLTLRLPFYMPVISHRHAVKYADRISTISETPGSVDDSNLALAYPLHEVACDSTETKRRPNIIVLLLESWRGDTMNETVSPNMWALAMRSSLFETHFASGNSTPSGVFSVFYGIHPTYWPAVKANSAAIHNPVLIDVLEENGYRFGIFADSHFDRHKIKDGMFRDIEVHEEFEGRSADERDRDLTNRLYRFAADANAAGRPFFGFAFYKSTHFNYFYPKDAARFQPATKINVMTAGSDRDPTAFFNDYKNAVYYLDGLIGDLVGKLEADGILKNTIIVITSDHGEEFNDNGENYWGHTSNFTGYQTRVPLIVYVPWEKPRRITTVTTHVDIPPTLLQEGLGCAQDAGDYSNGLNLFGPLPASRPVIISSYINHAIVANDDVYSVFPMYIQKYKLWDINAKADAIPPDLARQAMEEMSRFYRPRPPS